MTLNNSMSITPSPPGQAKGARFEHGSVLGGKTRAARVSSQWKSTSCLLGGERFSLGVDGGSVMMIIVTILRSLSMTTMICVRTVSIISSGNIITIIVDVLTTSTGIVFNERLE